MEEKLLGHLLKANDPATADEVERRLAADPAAARELARLRAALAPLEADREDIDPPADLWVRTLARVAGHIVATEDPQADRGPSQTEELIRRAAVAAHSSRPAAPPAAAILPATDAGSPPARRRNVAAVLGLSAAALALVFPAVVHLRVRAQQAACQDTMRQFYQAAAGYSDANEGRFPQVGDGQPAAVAAEALKAAGYLPKDIRFTCAGRPDEAAPVALANYAYSLGFRDEKGELHGLERRPDNNYLPILADAPRRQLGEAVPVNHRHGQNVLFAGGHVRFCTTVRVGPNEDDIFCNAHGRVGAGVSLFDAALGRPEELP